MEEKIITEEQPIQNRRLDYPVYDKKTLWLMSSEEFNNWRKKYDYPRIVAFLQNELAGFTQWQKEQRITTDQLITQGISAFLLEDDNYHLSILNKQTQNLKKPNKIFLPYFTWARKKKIKPHSQVQDYTLRADSFSWTPSTKTNEVYLLKKLRLLDLGGLKLEGISIGQGSKNKGNKNFEFTCLDNTTFINCYHAPAQINFSSAGNLHIVDCSFHHLSAFSTDFTGLSIERCSLQSWTLSKCRLSGYLKNSRISESEIKYFKFYQTNFFDFFSSLKIFDSAFVFDGDDNYHQYKSVKNAFSAQGDKAEAGKYYYLERKAHFSSRINYFIYNRWKLPFGTTKDGYSKFFSAVQYRFKNKKFSFFNACWDLVRFIGFRVGIVFSRKFFLDFLRHYMLLIFDFLDRIVRGYGEKPLRIILAALVILNVFTLFDFLLLSDQQNYLSLLYHNLLVFIGQGDFQDLSSTYLVMRFSQTLLGIFLISLFVADLSSKHRY